MIISKKVGKIAPSLTLEITAKAKKMKAATDAKAVRWIVRLEGDHSSIK
jgi:hypothetical protein